MKKLSRIIIQLLPVLVVIIVTVIVAVIGYSNIMEWEEDQCWSVLQNAADDVNEQIQIRLEDNGNFLKMTAGSILDGNALQDDQKLASKLKEVQDTTIFTRIDVLYPDGSALSTDGTRVQTELPFDEIAARGDHMSRRRTDPKTGIDVVGYAVPVEDEDGIQAMLIGIMECKQLSDLFQVKVYNEDTMVCIVDQRDGSLVMDNRHEKLGNIGDINDHKFLKGYEDVDAEKEIMNGQTGRTAFESGVNNEDSYMYYIPSENFPWEVLVIQQENVIFSSLYMMRRAMLRIGGIGLLMLIGYLLISIHKTNQLLNNQKETEHQLQISMTLNACVKELSTYSDIDQAIDHLLQIVNAYFDGDRTYLFENDYDRQITQNTYEYVAEGVTKEIDHLQNVPLSYIQFWIDMFQKQGTFYISDRDKEVKPGSGTYEALEAQNIRSLIAVPLMEEGRIQGFLGVDNPGKNYNDLSLLTSIEFYISDSLYRKAEQEKLRRMSFCDEPTGIYNRNKFEEVLQHYKENLIRDVGVAYFDLNGLKETNDRYGHKAGDRLIKKVTECIDFVFPKQAYRVGGDEFVVIQSGIQEKEFYELIQKTSSLLGKGQASTACGALWSEDSKNIEGQIHDAEKLMYEDKRKYHEAKRLRQLQNAKK